VRSKPLNLIIRNRRTGRGAVALLFLLPGGIPALWGFAVPVALIGEFGGVVDFVGSLHVTGEFVPGFA
jgi:hypothetical protein